MNFVKVENIPTVMPRRRLKAYLDEFMAMRIPMAEVKNHGYKSARVCQTCLYTAVKRNALPINVCKRGDKVYLIRRDMAYSLKD